MILWGQRQNYNQSVLNIEYNCDFVYCYCIESKKSITKYDIVG